MARRSHRGVEPGVLTWAVAWDVALGEPPAEADPRLWMIRGAQAAAGYAPQRSRAARGAYGLAGALLLPYAAWTAARLALGIAGRIHHSLYQEVATILLKGSLSIRATAEGTVEGEEASSAAQGGVTSAPVETSTASALVRMARGLKGNVVGPLFYYALLGIPGAVAYRALRIVSEQWGERGIDDPLGAAARRMEAIASIVPSVLSALLWSATAPLVGGKARRAWEAARREAAQAERLGGGWSEGALSGALGVRVGQGDGGSAHGEARAPTADDLARARYLTYAAAGGAVGATLALVLLRHALRRR